MNRISGAAAAAATVPSSALHRRLRRQHCVPSAGAKEISEVTLKHLKDAKHHHYTMTLESDRRGARLILDANPKFAHNWLALLNEPDDGTCRCEEPCEGCEGGCDCCSGTNHIDAQEKANVKFHTNGDCVYIGKQHEAGYLMCDYVPRIEPRKDRGEPPRKKSKT